MDSVLVISVLTEIFGKVNAASIFAALPTIYFVVNVIARITPTPKDDEIVSRVWKILNTLFLRSRTK